MVELNRWERRFIPKEELSGILKEAVESAHMEDNGVLGLVLFGSRSHGDEYATVYSDVDLVYVVDKPTSFAAISVLKEHLDRRFKPFGMVEHWIGTIYVGWLSELRDPERHMETRYLDRDSVFIILDSEAEKKVLDFVRPKHKTWTDPKSRV